MQFWMWGMGPAKATTINERYACRDTSPEVSAILGSAVVLRPPERLPHEGLRIAAFGGAPHQSRPPLLGTALTASPRGEKPCPATDAVRLIEAAASFSQRLLP